MKPETHAARDAQKTQPHKAGEDNPKPGKAKRKESRAGFFNPDAHKCWMFPANKLNCQ